jgi:hypothetical protein
MTVATTTTTSVFLKRDLEMRMDREQREREPREREQHEREDREREREQRECEKYKNVKVPEVLRKFRANELSCACSCLSITPAVATATSIAPASVRPSPIQASHSSKHCKTTKLPSTCSDPYPRIFTAC